MNSLILFEDEHLLAVSKPSGINTHKPDRYAQDGIHEWLTKREARWANLSILHRLDKDTSGVMIFGKTRQANQSLARQFETHQIAKTYLLLAEERPRQAKLRVTSGDAVTEFEFMRSQGKCFLVKARPVTGKTHQVRRHAAESGFPIVGDSQYGGAAAPRLMLHAHKIAFQHPQSGEQITIEAPLPKTFEETGAMTAAREFRELLFDEQTDAFRLISGSADGFEGVVTDSYAGKLLVQWLNEDAAERWRDAFSQSEAVYEQFTTEQRRTKPVMSGAKEETPLRFPIREYGLNFLSNFGEGFATGLFPDQRENRRRLMRMDLAEKTALNCFAYTCSFSVAAAKAGAVVTSVDLSKSYLEWGRENFRSNGLNPEAHDFIYGDVFSWLKRFGKRGRTWDVVILDPPTFSTTKKGRLFRAASDYRELAELAMPLIAPRGTLFCSTNQRSFSAETLESILRETARRGGRIVESLDYETQPFDFRIAAGEQPYLKTFWVRFS